MPKIILYYSYLELATLQRWQKTNSLYKKLEVVICIQTNKERKKLDSSNKESMDIQTMATTILFVGGRVNNKATHKPQSLELKFHYHIVEVSSLLPSTDEESCNASPKG